MYINLIKPWHKKKTIWLTGAWGQTPLIVTPTRITLDLRSQVIWLGSQLEESFLTHLSTIRFSLRVGLSLIIRVGRVTGKRYFFGMPQYAYHKEFFSDTTNLISMGRNSELIVQQIKFKQLTFPASRANIAFWSSAVPSFSLSTCEMQNKLYKQNKY